MGKLDEIIEQHEGELTPEAAAALLDAAFQGDTAQAEPASPPVDAPAAAPAANPTANDTGAPDPANAVVLARDGVHTIPYSELEAARKQAQETAQALAQAKQEAEELRAMMQQAQQAPQTHEQMTAQAEQAIAMGVDPEIFGDFSEEALAKGIAQVVAMNYEQLKAQFDAQLKALESRLNPVIQERQQQQFESEIDRVFAAHPDAQSLAESQELKQWIDAQPSLIRGAYESAYQNGSSTQLIELFDAYKAANGLANPSGSSVQALAQQAIANARLPTPASLSDFSTGRANGVTEIDLLSDVSDGVTALGMFDGKSAEQVNQMLNSL